MATVEENTEKLNSLLRGEIAAVETYTQSLSKFEDDEAATAELRRMAAEHANSVALLRKHIEEHGGVPDADSGVWGTWAQLLTGAAKLLGKNTAVKALKEGEEHGIKEYEEALEDPDFPDDCKTLIRSELLPAQRAHIQSLNKLLEANKD